MDLSPVRFEYQGDAKTLLYDELSIIKCLYLPFYRLLLATQWSRQRVLFQSPWKRSSIIPKCVLEVEIAMGAELPLPQWYSRADFRF